MIISDLNVLEVVEAAEVVGGVIGTRAFVQNDTANFIFTSLNTFQTIINPQPVATGNSAAAGAKADAYNVLSGTLAGLALPTRSFSKADTFALTDYLGGSTSGSSSVAVINAI